MLFRSLESGLKFGRQGAGFARLNFACSPEVLTEAVARLARVRATPSGDVQA